MADIPPDGFLGAADLLQTQNVQQFVLGLDALASSLFFFYTWGTSLNRIDRRAIGLVELSL